MVALEAGICCTPTIASRVGGLSEAINDGETGFLVDVNNNDLLAETIIKVLTNDSLRKRLGDNARARVLDNYTWDKISTKIERIYKEVLADSLTR